MVFHITFIFIQKNYASSTSLWLPGVWKMGVMQLVYYFPAVFHYIKVEV